jgi:hypothetical protein
MSINTSAPPGPLPADPPYPGPGPGDAPIRIRRLHHDGSTRRAASTAVGPAPATVRDLARGRLTGGTAAAARTVTAEDAPRARLDATGTRLRLRALHVMGHNCVRIARALDVSETTIKDLVRGGARTVSPELRDAVADLYDAWWDKRAPARTRFERAAVTLARRRAIAGNWCAGAALDDDQLDTPGYRPQYGWKPATGTGTAPDIRLPGRHHRRRKGA